MTDASNIQGALHIDAPLGSRRKKIKKMYMQYAAGALIRATDTGNVLFIQRSSTGDHAGEWAFPGGGIEPGVDDTAAEAAERECQEETGYALSGNTLKLFDHRVVNGVDFTTYSARVPTEFVPTLNDEHVAYCWKPVNEPPTPLHPGVAATLGQPRTLYVYRPVLNADQLIAWAKQNAGCVTCVTPDDMHVTLAYSKAPVKWPKPFRDTRLVLNVKNAHVAMFGPEHDCVVLQFESSDLQQRWQFFCDQGASWSWPDYQPHLTLSYNGFNELGTTPREIPPYSGPIILGPEQFEVVSAGWGDNIVQKIGWTDEARTAASEARHKQAANYYQENPADDRARAHLTRLAAHTTSGGTHEHLHPGEVTVYRVGTSDRSSRSFTTSKNVALSHAEVGKPVKLTEMKLTRDIPAIHMNRLNPDSRFTHEKEVYVDTRKLKKGDDMNDDFLEQDRLQKIGRRNNKSDAGMIQQMHDHAVSLGAVCPTGHKMVKAEDGAVARIAKIDESLGLVFGYAIVCTKDGAPYYDLNVDKQSDGSYKRVPEHIPEAAMLKAAVDFAKSSRPGNEMHGGPDSGEYVFVFPLTADIAKAFNINTSTTGLMIAYKPTPEVFAKFKDGTYTGFSIEGRRVTVEEHD